MNAVVAQPPQTMQPPAREPSPAESAFGLAQRQARALSASSLVPEAYRGDKNLANVMIAMELAQRLGSSPLLVMQSLHIVSGKPSWSSSFLIATVNACKRFEPLRFEIVGDDPHRKDYKVRAVAKDKASGEMCIGTWIDWKMVDAEGWAKKSGSKWITMPGQMFLYRAAGFWTRVYAPEISLGILTVEEAVDVWGVDTRQPHAPTDVGSIRALERELTGQPEEPEAIAHDAEPEPEQGKPLEYDPDTGEILPLDLH